MNEQIKDGGPAFPQAFAMSPPLDQGMTLRDYFAAKAMQGTLAYPGDVTSGSAHNNSSPEDIAFIAYKYADAMLAAREAKS